MNPMRNRIQIFFLLISLFILPSVRAFSSDTLLPDYRFYSRINWGVEASVVTCLVQDTQGLMWAGTNRGLFSYDGYTARPHFQLGQSNNTRIYCGAVADSTYLYLGADNGLLIYDYRKDEYVDNGIEFPRDIRALAWFDGRWWIGTLQGLYTYQPVTGELVDVSDGLPHRTVYALQSTSDGRLYVGTYNGCCFRTRKENAYKSVVLPVARGKSNSFVNALLEDKRRGCLWIGMEGSLLKYDFVRNRTVAVDGFDGNSIKSLALDDEGQVLAGTDNGLYVYDERTALRHIVHDSRDPHSLSSNIVWTVLPDVDGNIWLGTDYGISLSKQRSLLQHVPISFVTSTGEGNQFYAMLRDRQGYFWFGGTNGLIRFRWPVYSGGEDKAIWYKMGDVRYPLSHNRVRQLFEDGDGNLWVATDGGVNRYDAIHRRFVSYNIVDSTHRYNANWVYGLSEDKDGRLWIATCLGGIFVIDKRQLLRGGRETYLAEKMFTPDNGLSGLFVNQMVQDRKGNVWALFYNNVNSIDRIDPCTGRVEHVVPDILKNKYLPNFLLCGSDGYLWVGTQGGVIRLNPEDESVRFLAFDADRHHEVLFMAEVKGKICISTTDGFWMADMQTLEMRWLNVAEQHFTSIYFDEATDKLYLGTVDGFSVTSLQSLLEPCPEHPLVLTALFVNNRLYHPEEGECDGSIRYTHRLRLAHHQRNLAFEWSDLPYSSEEKSRFLYRWNNTGNAWTYLHPGENRITFNNLDYGKHDLLVSKLDANGQPDWDNLYVLNIEILPPWYYTDWAQTAYAFLAIALLAWAINFFLVKSRLKRVRIEKENILEQSRSKMEFFANLSHDLKTPLSMIIAPVSRLLPDIRDGRDKQVLEQVQRNAMKLNALIHSGLDFNRVDSGSNLLLIQSRIELVSFARSLFCLYAEDPIRGKTLRFDFQTSLPELYIQMDAIKLESILDNLLSNAVKYTPEGGTVTLSLSTGGNNGLEVLITVADTGMGIPQQDQPYVFQRFFQSHQTAGKKEGTGIGLYLVKTYTELHGGHVQLQSEEGVGTTITLILPVVEPTRFAPEREERAGHLQAAQSLKPHKAETVLLPPPEAPMVLVVEDHPDTADFIYQVLHARYHCRMARNGREGLDLALETPPDLIISDVMMPVMDGFEMVCRLKKQVPLSTTPIILLTGRSDKQTELESIRLHIEAFIAKPFEPDILLSRVEQLLVSRQTYEAKARLEAIATPKEIEAVSSDEKFLAHVTNLIEQHISDPDLNVNALCEWSSTNNKQMYRKIKQLTGMTPVEYIKSIRMKKAAILLKQHTFTVAEVMYMVGFSNHSYFSKCFQSEFGVTPKQY